MQQLDIQKDQDTTKQYRITKDQVSVSTNYKYDMNWWIQNKAHTTGANFTFLYHPGCFPAFPHDG